MSDFFLSIIVPVFKVERFIDICTESLFRNLLPEVEYVFVDDCSPDQSIQHVRNQAQRHQIPKDQIRFLRNDQNQGLSITRNNGEAVASGKYIWFVDSDDWIEDGILPKLIDFLKKNQPEVLALPVIHSDAGSYSSEYTPYLKKYSGEFEGKKLLCGASPCAQFYIFDHSFWRKNNFSFYPGIYHEDTELTPRIRYLAKRVMAFPEIAYYYRITEGSIVAVPKLKRAIDLLFVAQRNRCFMNEQVRHEDFPLFSNIIAITLTNSFSVASLLKKEEQLLFLKETKKNKDFFSVCLGCSKLKHKTLTLFRILSPSILLYFYRVKRKMHEKRNGNSK